MKLNILVIAMLWQGRRHKMQALRSFVKWDVLIIMLKPGPYLYLYSF